jgi:hypothetical protein
MLRSRNLPVYAVDLRSPDGTQRRLLVGRYATREGAEKVRAGLAGVFDEARVILGVTERVP